MFRASLCPSSRATTTAVVASGIQSELGNNSAVGRGRASPDRPRPTTLLPPRSNGKPEAATAVDELLVIGMRIPEICWAVFKRQIINLRNCCIWLVDSFEYMIMHGLTIPKFLRFYVHFFDFLPVFRVWIPNISKFIKCKIIPVLTMKDMGRLVIDPLILNFESRWRWVVQLKLWLLYYNTHWIGSWVVSRADLEVDEGNLLPCHYSAVVQHVASSLYWSRYSDPHFIDHYYTS